MDAFISILVLILAPLGMLVCLELEIAAEAAEAFPGVERNRRARAGVRRAAP
jgi:hypothetical protein